MWWREGAEQELDETDARTDEWKYGDPRTLSLWSICRIVSPSAVVQLGGGLPGPPPYIEFGVTAELSVEACAIPHRLLSLSLMEAASAPENR